MRRRILIVDDNLINRKLLCNTLRDEYDILEAENGQQALKMLDEYDQSVSAMLLDLLMPVMDGYATLRAVRANADLTQIPILITTGNAAGDAEARALALGANDFITKPYDPVIIRHRLRNAISLWENAAALNALRRDKLTGLWNREAFYEKVEELIAKHPPGYYVLDCFDVDRFKVINDQYGTEKGDAVLRMLADVFRDGLEPEGGLCCRVMADNFAMLYPRTFIGSNGLERIRRRVTLLDGSLQPITFSVGRYIVNDLKLSVNAMYDRARLAASTIKGRYDVHVAVYDESMRERLLQEQKVVTDMHGALKNGEFELWLQPQYNHASGEMVGAEVLARWRHRESGRLIPPSEFIPVFERNGFIYEMDKYIWEQTCVLLRRWMDEGREPMPLSVNVSRYDMLRESFFSVITGLVQRYAIPVELLRLEITESAFAEATGVIVALVRRLVAFGFTVEIDDFGSGYSSLNTLKSVPANILKLDMRFLENDDDSSRGGNILESVVRMAKWLGTPVIAEGVETQVQADYLRSIGCNLVQGYLYARPMPVDEFEALMAQTSCGSRSPVLETVETLDNDAFWNPKSMDTLIFNSYVGGACIFEYHNGKGELLRVNEKYAQEIGLPPNTSFADKNLERYLDGPNLAVLHRGVQRAIQTREECSFEFCLQGIPGQARPVYLRSTIRAIASAQDRWLFYCAIFNTTQQRETEKKERALSERMQAIMDNVDCGITATAVRADGSLDYLFVNDRYCELLGCTRAQLVEQKQDVFARIPPEDLEQIKIRVHGIGTTPECFELRIRRNDGELRWLRVIARETSFGNVPDRVQLAILTDVTAEKEEAERMGRQRRELLDQLPCGVGVYAYLNGAFRVEYLNRRYEELVGREVMDNGKISALEYVHPDDLTRVRAAVRETISRGGTEACCDLRVQHGDGHYRAFHTTARIRRDDEENAMVYATFAPISEEKATIGQMLPSVLAAVMKNSSDLSFVKDQELRYLCCSRAFAQMAGLNDENDVVGKTDFDLFDEPLAKRYRENDLQLLDSRNSQVDYVEPIVSDDGTSHYSSTSKYLLYDTLGRVVGLYGVGRDVTADREAYERLKLLTDSIPGGLATYEISAEATRLLYCSDGYHCHTGYSREEYQALAAQNPMCLISPKDLPGVRSQIAAVLNGSQRVEFQYRAHTKENELRWLDVRGVVVERRGALAVVNLVKLDVTRQKQAEESLRMSEEQYRLALKHSGSLICRYEVADRSLHMTAEVAAIFGRAETTLDVPYENVRLGLVSKRTEKDYIAFYEAILRGAETGSVVVRGQTASGMRWLKLYHSSIFSDEGKPVRAVISFRDITEQHRQEQRALKSKRALQKQAETDGLTGLYNRAKAETQIKERLARRSHAPCALMIADLDDLKGINDTLGHPQGDRAIRLLAETLRGYFPQESVVGRIGGDEFIIYLEGAASVKTLTKRLNGLNQKIAGLIVADDTRVHASIGVALGVTGRSVFDDLYKQADSALYDAKRRGKDCYAFDGACPEEL